MFRGCANNMSVSCKQPHHLSGHIRYYTKVTYDYISCCRLPGLALVPGCRGRQAFIVMTYIVMASGWYRAAVDDRPLCAARSLRCHGVRDRRVYLGGAVGSRRRRHAYRGRVRIGGDVDARRLCGIVGRLAMVGTDASSGRCIKLIC